jgi:hypothetical protein
LRPYGTLSRPTWRRVAFARRRVDRIATVLGGEEVRKTIEDAEGKFSKKIGPRDWAIFIPGRGSAELFRKLT